MVQCDHIQEAYIPRRFVPQILQLGYTASQINCILTMNYNGNQTISGKQSGFHARGSNATSQPHSRGNKDNFGVNVDPNDIRVKGNIPADIPSAAVTLK